MFSNSARGQGTFSPVSEVKLHFPTVPEERARFTPVPEVETLFSPVPNSWRSGLIERLCWLTEGTAA